MESRLQRLALSGPSASTPSLDSFNPTHAPRRKQINVADAGADPSDYDPLANNRASTRVARAQTSRVNPQSFTAIPSQVARNAPLWQSADTGGSFTVTCTISSADKPVTRQYFKDGKLPYQNPVLYLSRIDYVRDNTGAANLPTAVQVRARVINGDHLYNTVTDTALIKDPELRKGYLLLFNLLAGAPVAQSTDSINNIMTPLGTLQDTTSLDIELVFIDPLTETTYTMTQAMGTGGYITLTFSGAFML